MLPYILVAPIVEIIAGSWLKYDKAGVRPVTGEPGFARLFPGHKFLIRPFQRLDTVPFGCFQPSSMQVI